MKLCGTGRNVTSAGLMREESPYLLLTSTEKWIGQGGYHGAKQAREAAPTSSVGWSDGLGILDTRASEVSSSAVGARPCSLGKKLMRDNCPDWGGVG